MEFQEFFNSLSSQVDENYGMSLKSTGGTLCAPYNFHRRILCMRKFGSISLITFKTINIYSQQGHKLKVHYIKNCGDIAKNIIKVQENSTITITDDCLVIPSACAETSGFASAKVKYQIWKNNLPILRNEIDACEAATKLNTDIKSMLKLFGLPSKCPVEAVRK